MSVTHSFHWSISHPSGTGGVTNVDNSGRNLEIENVEMYSEAKKSWQRLKKNKMAKVGLRLRGKPQDKKVG